MWQHWINNTFTNIAFLGSLISTRRRQYNWSDTNLVYSLHTAAATRHGVWQISLQSWTQLFISNIGIAELLNGNDTSLLFWWRTSPVWLSVCCPGLWYQIMERIIVDCLCLTCAWMHLRAVHWWYVWQCIFPLCLRVSQAFVALGSSGVYLIFCTFALIFEPYFYMLTDYTLPITLGATLGETSGEQLSGIPYTVLTWSQLWGLLGICLLRRTLESSFVYWSD